jgi:hypothetical protein
MSLEGIFINGVYRGVLSDIHNVQTLVPEQILYLQPYSGERIVKLSENPPSLIHEAMNTMKTSSGIVFSVFPRRESNASAYGRRLAQRLWLLYSSFSSFWLNFFLAIGALENRKLGSGITNEKLVIIAGA